MIKIDGSQGEGGGQILRTSLALSLVTGKPFRISNIRKGRRKPGLMRQHLTSLRAATAVGKASVEGDSIGSQEVTFRPKTIQSGDYEFTVGTAGSTTLVLQTVLPALLVADSPSTLVLQGGTHNPYAPPFDFLAKTFLPVLNRMGAEVTAELVAPGFYPAGGGEIRVSISPCHNLETLHLLERKAKPEVSAQAVVSNLPAAIAERELDVVRRELGLSEERTAVAEISSSGPGNVVTLEVDTGEVCEIFTGFGEINVTSAQVGHRVAQEAKEFIESDVPVGKHLADQLLVPMAMAGKDLTGPSNRLRIRGRILR